MVSKEQHTRARKITAPVPKQAAKKKLASIWTTFQREYNFESAVVKQLTSGHRKAFLNALYSSQQTKGLPHRVFVVYQAAAAGYLRGQKTERVGGRVPKRLISAAMKKSGIQSQSELLEYALSKVALEDDYGKKLLSLKGSIPDDVEF
jgi:uncharacterized protein (DUF2336 family)